MTLFLFTATPEGWHVHRYRWRYDPAPRTGKNRKLRQKPNSWKNCRKRRQWER